MMFLERIKKCLVLVIILLAWNIMMIQTNKLVAGKIKDETAGVLIT